MGEVSVLPLLFYNEKPLNTALNTTYTRYIRTRHEITVDTGCIWRRRRDEHHSVHALWVHRFYCGKVCCSVKLMDT